MIMNELKNMKLKTQHTICMWGSKDPSSVFANKICMVQNNAEHQSLSFYGQKYTDLFQNTFICVPQK